MGMMTNSIYEEFRQAVVQEHALCSITHRMHGTLGSMRSLIAACSHRSRVFRFVVASAVLANRSGDEDALAVKLFALLTSSRHADALSMLENDSNLQQKARLEKAYCIWKVHGVQAALDTLAQPLSTAEKHLQALLLMRAGQHATAQEQYASLLTAVKGDKQAATELARASSCDCIFACPDFCTHCHACFACWHARHISHKHLSISVFIMYHQLVVCLQATNAIAARVMTEDNVRQAPDAAKQILKSAGMKAEDSFEVAFNVACAAVAAGDLVAADQLLDLADRRGQEVLMEEDASQEVRPGVPPYAMLPGVAN